MTRSLAVLPAVTLLAIVLACNAESTVTEDSTPRVVVKSSHESSARDLSGGVAVGPDADAPEIVVLNETPQEPATRRTVRKQAPGPRVIYETIIIEEQPPVSEEPDQPVPETVPDPIIEPETTPVVPEPQPTDVPDPVATAPTTTPDPTTVPTGGSSRTEDAIVGAAIGAGVGAILGGRRGAVAGGVGGAIGGATGGRAGGILGGILGGSTGGGACIPEPRCHPRRGRCY